MKEEVLFLSICSIGQLLECADTQMKTPSARVCVYIIEENIGKEAGSKNKIRKAAEALQKCSALTVILVDSMVDADFLDCMISADICITTEYGKWNPESKYTKGGLYSEEHICFLLGQKDRYLEETFQEGGLINFATDREHMKDMVYQYLSSLLFAKGERQLSCIKQYFNLYKTPLWKQQDQLADAESRCFCFLARNQEEAEKTDGV